MPSKTAGSPVGPEPGYIVTSRLEWCKQTSLGKTRSAWRVQGEFPISMYSVSQSCTQTLINIQRLVLVEA